MTSCAEFLAIAPNNRIPAIVDHDVAGGPVSLFEWGDPAVSRGQDRPLHPAPATQVQPRAEVLQWLFWQMGRLGPMAGRDHHFSQYAPEKIPYAINRYVQ